jgi:hypothetical protein
VFEETAGQAPRLQAGEREGLEKEGNRNRQEAKGEDTGK